MAFYQRLPAAWQFAGLAAVRSLSLDAADGRAKKMREQNRRRAMTHRKPKNGWLWSIDRPPQLVSIGLVDPGHILNLKGHSFSIEERH